MRYLLVLYLLFFISCEKPHPDIEEDFAIMEGDIPEPDTTTLREECVFDTSYYTLTIEALRGIPDIKEIAWIDSNKTAEARWRNHTIGRTKGGCDHFADNLIVVYSDTTTVERTDYWLGKATEAARHFGIPYYALSSKETVIELDSSLSDRYRKHFQITPLNLPENQVLEGVIIEDQGNSTRLSLRQYTN